MSFPVFEDTNSTVETILIENDFLTSESREYGKNAVFVSWYPKTIYYIYYIGRKP